MSTYGKKKTPLLGIDFNHTVHYASDEGPERWSPTWNLWIRFLKWEFDGTWHSKFKKRDFFLRSYMISLPYLGWFEWSISSYDWNETSIDYNETYRPKKKRWWRRDT